MHILKCLNVLGIVHTSSQAQPVGPLACFSGQRLTSYGAQELLSRCLALEEHLAQLDSMRLDALVQMSECVG